MSNSKFLVMFNRIKYKFQFKTTDRNWKLWVFGEWFGKKCNDSPLYFANYVAKTHKDIKLIWIAKNNCVGLDALDPSINVVEMDSEEAIKIMKSAGAAFVNEGLQDLSSQGYNYLNGALIINLWHGIAWKKIGLDTYKPHQIFEKLYARIIYSLQDFAYFPTSSEMATKTLCSGFDRSKDSLIKSGFPRNDIFYDEYGIKEAREKIINALRTFSDVINENTKIIAYLPTFRDRSSTNFDFKTLPTIDYLEKFLSDNNAVIVQKAHIVNQNRNDSFNGDKRATRIITWNDCSAQELMAASEMLITDYSSCFFDYLILDRPIIHYLYDYDYYSGDDRGLYYKKEDVVCGDVAMTNQELIDCIEKNLLNPDKDKDLREKRRNEFLTYERPNSCEVIANFVLAEINRKTNGGYTR